MLIQKNTYRKYCGKIYKKRKAISYIYKENTIIQAVSIYKSIYTEILWAGGKAKEKEMVSIYKRNTPMYIGKIHIQRIYLDKIYKKKKASFFYIYIVKHIFFIGQIEQLQGKKW